MTARDLDTILSGDWNSNNVATPTFVNERYITVNPYVRAVGVFKEVFEGDFMGIISRTYYTPETSQKWRVRIVSTTSSDVEAMIKEVQRICAEFTSTTTEAWLAWEGGEYTNITPFRYEFTATVMVKVVGISFA